MVRYQRRFVCHRFRVRVLFVDAHIADMRIFLNTWKDMHTRKVGKFEIDVQCIRMMILGVMDDATKNGMDAVDYLRIRKDGTLPCYGRKRACRMVVSEMEPPLKKEKKDEDVVGVIKKPSTVVCVPPRPLRSSRVRPPHEVTMAILEVARTQERLLEMDRIGYAVTSSYPTVSVFGPCTDMRIITKGY